MILTDSEDDDDSDSAEKEEPAVVGSAGSAEKDVTKKTQRLKATKSSSSEATWKDVADVCFRIFSELDEHAAGKLSKDYVVENLVEQGSEVASRLEAVMRKHDEDLHFFAHAHQWRRAFTSDLLQTEDERLVTEAEFVYFFSSRQYRKLNRDKAVKTMQGLVRGRSSRLNLLDTVDAHYETRSAT